METPQYHIILNIAQRLLDRDVLEHTVVIIHKAIHPGPHIPTPVEHNSCAPVPYPGFAAWEEVCGQVFKASCSKGLCNIFVSRISLQCIQVHVKVTGHQKRGPMGAMDDGQDDNIYGQDTVWGQVKNHYVPPLLSQLQLESDNIGAMEAERLKNKVLCLVLEDRNTRPVTAWCVSRKEVATYQLPRAEPPPLTSVSWNIPRPMLACTIPRKAESNPPFLPLWILYNPNQIDFMPPSPILPPPPPLPSPPIDWDVHLHIPDQWVRFLLCPNVCPVN